MIAKPDMAATMFRAETHLYDKRERKQVLIKPFQAHQKSAGHEILASAN